ncbi:alpha/beta hydrolase [Jeotgalibacillus proteolyticus]|uniref:Alpha/beta hydrolase n=1 Tax=Jeotgalibacillus proteolyticus TaxID=2082395 RepID=A0A2S5GG83_9BACL|nr:alpha/beta hydrolase [Jeotgalibacillus proteolyticus]PPA71978.1 alpha/beta hydrolase [Jeotgalibacillus proteolyticus]
MEGSFFRTSDGIDVYLCTWLSKTKDVKGVVQLVHGMVEHIDRYEEFAEFLTQEGYHVVGHDQRGHGQTAERNGRLGYISDGDGFLRIVNDVKEININAREKYNLPVYLIGHSMGSFVARRVIQLYPNLVDGTILIGTAGPAGFAGEIGKVLAKASSIITSPEAPGKILSQLTFGSYNKRFKPCNSPVDWLSRDHTVVERYLEDPLCGFICSNKFYQDLFSGISVINRKKEIKKIPQSMPIYLISGSADPVGKDGKGVFIVAKQLKKAGIEDVEVRLYEDGRHELLKESNRQLIFLDTLQKLETWTGKNKAI